MKYKCIGFRILLRPISIQEDAKLPEGLKQSQFKIVSGLDKNAEHRAKSEIQFGDIIAMGPLCYKHRDYGYGTVTDEEWKDSWPKVGDKVYYGKHSGYFVDDPEFPGEVDKQFYLVNDDDIKMIVEE